MVFLPFHLSKTLLKKPKNQRYRHGHESFREMWDTWAGWNKDRAERLKPLVRWKIEDSFDDLKVKEKAAHGAKNEWKLKGL